MIALSFVLLGHPVGHSMSPAIHAEVYRHFGLPHRYSALDCADEASVANAVQRVRTGELAGANVTVPWKRVALRLADRVDPSAGATGAANVLLRAADGAVVAHNTDVPALVERLRERACSNPKRAVVLGNGGAALAAVAACVQLGADHVTVSARAFSAELPATQWRDVQEFERLGARPLAWQAHGGSDLQQALRQAQVVVQATSAGMSGKGGEELASLLPWTELAKDCFLYDVVYNPGVTPFIRDAQRHGLSCESGLPMLVGQAALAVKLWLGLDAPRAAMQQVAERHLQGLNA